MQIAAPKSLQRAGLSAAAAAVLLSTAGCSYINPVTTAEVGYAPADGIVLEIGEVNLTNPLIVATSAEEEGRLLGSIDNGYDEDVTVTVDTGVATAEIDVPAGGAVLLEDVAEPVILDPAGAVPGLMVETEISFAGESATESVPVLDHTFERYAEFVPGGAPDTPANPSNVPAEVGEEGYVGGQQADEH